MRFPENHHWSHSSEVHSKAKVNISQNLDLIRILEKSALSDFLKIIIGPIPRGFILKLTCVDGEHQSSGRPEYFPSLSQGAGNIGADKYSFQFEKF